MLSTGLTVYKNIVDLNNNTSEACIQIVDLALNFVLRGLKTKMQSI